MSEREWWRQAVVYQIYPRSFADSNGDGIGDLSGVTSRVRYLADLGVDAVWLSPFYPSALADGGYDVDDYRAVDPTLGSLEDFDDLVSELHDAGIKVVVDIVPNHSSDRHAWFREALAGGPGSPARERYIFRDGAGPDGSEPPNDWESTFGGSAWAQVPDGQWYLHLFAAEQPDLNWDNPEVHQDFLKTLRFWADRGVDGFRVDVAHALAKDLSEPYLTAAELMHHDELMLAGTHPLWDREELDDIYAEWRKVFDEYDPPRSAVAEVWVPPSRRPRYARPESLGQAFNFDLLRAPWDAGEFTEVITENLELARESGATSTWVLSNHDVVRHASRYGLATADLGGQNQWLLSRDKERTLDRATGLRRARAATMLILALPGSAYLFQGEELGLHEVAELSPKDLQDPIWERSFHMLKGRDGARVPLPWTSSGSSYGFGADGAHLPQPAWFGEVAVEMQVGKAGSTLELYRDALRLRRSLVGDEELSWCAAAKGVLHFARSSGWQSVTNMTLAPVPMPPGDVLLASEPLLDDGSLPAETTAWLRVDAG
jgi:alpha-glucosidase